MIWLISFPLLDVQWGAVRFGKGRGVRIGAVTVSLLLAILVHLQVCYGTLTEHLVTNRCFHNKFCTISGRGAVKAQGWQGPGRPD